MIKKIIIFIVVVILIWAGANYFNSKNQVEEIIIGGEESEQMTDTSGDSSSTTVESIADRAKTYCSQENVSTVYISEDKIKIVSSLLGGGSTYLSVDGSPSFTCPVVSLDSMSEECKAIANIDSKNWIEVCPAE